MAFRPPETVRHDLRYGALTLAVGTGLGVATTQLVLSGRIALVTTRPTVTTLLLEVAVYVLCFDAYFYALHRLLHTRALFRAVHAVHHRARTPSALTALAFHPLEALAILSFVPAALWLAPIHLGSLVVVSVFLSGSIFLAHAARDPFPDWWERVPVLGSYVTPRVHHAHHARRDCNFSATFSLFDRLCGTLERCRARRP